MTKLDKFLRENRENLDTENVDPKLWLEIENQILKAKNRQTRKLNKWIIVIVAAMSMALLAFFALNRQNSSSVDQRFLEQYLLDDQQYVDKINMTRASLQAVKIPQSRAADFQILVNQLELLDQHYESYAEYVKIYGYQDFIGQKIVEYYQDKLEILTRIHSEIQKIENYENRYENTTKVSLSL